MTHHQKLVDLTVLEESVMKVIDADYVPVDVEPFVKEAEEGDEEEYFEDYGAEDFGYNEDFF